MTNWIILNISLFLTIHIFQVTEYLYEFFNENHDRLYLFSSKVYIAPVSTGLYLQLATLAHLTLLYVS